MAFGLLNADTVTLAENDKQKIQAICDIFEYLNQEGVLKDKESNEFTWFILFENEDILKLMIKKGTDLDSFFEGNLSARKKIKYNYYELMRTRGSQYVERVIDVLRRTHKSLGVTVDKLISNFQNEAFFKIEMESCNELIEKLQKLIIIEKDFQNKVQEEKIKEEIETQEREKYEKGIKQEIYEEVKTFKSVDDKKEENKPIQKREGISEEFSIRIQELINNSSLKERVMPVFLYWYDKEDKNFDSNELTECRELLFKAIKKREYETGIRASLFIFTDSDIEESKRVMRQVKNEALKIGYADLVEGIVAEHGSYMIDANEDVTKMCIMSSKIHDRIIEISQKILKYFPDTNINEQIKSYVNYQIQADEKWGEDYNRYIINRISSDMNRGNSSQAIKYCPYSKGSKNGIDVILEGQLEAENRVTEYYQSKYEIDTDSIRTSNIIEILRKIKSHKMHKGEESKDRNE